MNSWTKTTQETKFRMLVDTLTRERRWPEPICEADVDITIHRHNRSGQSHTEQLEGFRTVVVKHG